MFLSNKEDHIVKEFEHILYWYKMGILQLGSGDDDTEKKLIKNFIRDYNLCIDDSIAKLERIKEDVFVNKEELKINEESDR